MITIDSFKVSVASYTTALTLSAAGAVGAQPASGRRQDFEDARAWASRSERAPSDLCPRRKRGSSGTHCRPGYSRVVLLASIVVLNWKDEVATARCVASVRQLEGVEDCEIIVVDNESTEASRRALAGLGDLRILPLDNNRGFAGGMNAALDIARGAHIALLNNDLVVDPAWLNEGLRVFRDPTAGIVGGASLEWDGYGLPSHEQ